MVRHAIRTAKKQLFPDFPSGEFQRQLSTTGAGRCPLPELGASGQVHLRLDLYREALKPGQSQSLPTTWEDSNLVALRHVSVLAHLCTVLLVGLALMGSILVSNIICRHARLGHFRSGTQYLVDRLPTNVGIRNQLSSAKC